MIDKDVFAWEMSLLDTHFGGGITEDSVTLIYAILSERMNSQEFITACKKAYLGKSFPRIEDLIMLVKESSLASHLMESYQRGFNDGYIKSSLILTEYYSQEIAKLHAQNLELRQRLGL